MRILHLPAWFAPYSTGGTETYVLGLIRGLRQLGADSLVAIPRPKNAPTEFVFDGIRVLTYPVAEQPDAEEIRGTVAPRFFREFLPLLQDVDVVHQHAWTRGCGLFHLGAAKALGKPLVFTAHVPGIVCQRGTMILNGRSPCDGAIIPERCASCWALSRGVPAALASLAAVLPKSIAQACSRPGLGRAATLISAQVLAASKFTQLQEIAAKADRIVAVSQWLYDALVKNGVHPDKLIVSRQGVDATADEPGQAPLALIGTDHTSVSCSVYRFAFLGRWDPVKGIDIAVQSFRKLPTTVNAVLEIRAVGNDPLAAKCRQRIERLSAGDIRISIEDPIPSDNVLEYLKTIDTLLVPSIWLETGPMVVLEAMRAGTRVLGSAAGGIAEWSREYGPEWVALAPIGDIEAWAAAMTTMMKQRRAERGPPRAIRTMADVASEMLAVYEKLLTKLEAAPTVPQSSLHTL